jgi:hypothetical protein
MPLLLLASMLPADASAPLWPPAAQVEDLTDWQGEWEVVACKFFGDDQTSLFKGDRWVVSSRKARLIDGATGQAGCPITLLPDRLSPDDSMGVEFEAGVAHRGAYRRDGAELIWTWGNGRDSITWTLRKAK